MRTPCLIVAAWAACFGSAFTAETLLVDAGQPRAEIVIAEQSPRTVRLAAHELQSYVEKISGARLPIVTQPGDQAAVQVYVGRSRYTDQLNISTDDLRDGAYRIVSGDGWLALVGNDTDFVPPEPWARGNSDIARVQQAWQKITGEPWGVPNTGMYKNRLRLPGELGKPDDASTDKNERLELWGFDERGSFNAVCGWLRQLGVRWYLPGELGEVVPRLPTMALPKIDQTVRPDFPIRRFNFRFATSGYDTAMWAMRLGLRDPYGYQVAHGMSTMTRSPAIFAAHPDWFALYGGRRHYHPDNKNNQLCYSNQELFEQTVRYARAQFDQYQLDTVSVMPPDGYTSICQCPLCAGKDMPDRGSRGVLSDYVWDFVNRVAREVGKTHPDKKILNCAYGSYTLPPLNIDKLEPNVQVCIVGGRRPRSNLSDQQHEVSQLRAGWLAKTDHPIMIFENYPFTSRGWYLPAYTAHSIGDSINATKGDSLGEDIWLSVGLDFDKAGIGFNHFLVYFTARMYWGGPAQQVDDLLREYCRLFYGPAEQQMLDFFAHCEANWQTMETDKSQADAALTLFAAAQAQVEPGSIYAQRLALIDDFLKGLRNKSTQLGRIRGPVPKLRLVGEARSAITVDGQLNDAAWTNAPVSATGRLRELQTGRAPTLGTSVRAAWRGSDLYLAIRCDELPGDKPNSTSTTHDDAALWYGDCIEVLLETDARSYYQIAVNPAGAVADLDRSVDKNSWFSWTSLAEVATHVADDHWTVEMRIPVTDDENDPLHQVIGRKPTQSLPWHINICRQRIRENGSEYSAFSPTGAATFHHVMKFAHFYDGRSHEFDAGEPDDDFLFRYRNAAELAQRNEHAAALAAFVALADGKLTELQKSVALEQAVAAALALKNNELADELTARIPLEPVRKTVLMHNLLANQQAAEVVARFGHEPIDTWPIWQRAAGYLARGRAQALLKSGAAADADLTRAAQLASDPRQRRGIWLAIGRNREQTLDDRAGALDAYRAVIAGRNTVSGADEFAAVQAIARLLTVAEKYDEALATLDLAKVESLRGTWRGAMLLARGETLAAAGRTHDARRLYRSAASDQALELRHRQLAAEKLTSLELPQ